MKYNLPLLLLIIFFTRICASNDSLQIDYYKNGNLKSKLYFHDGKPHGIIQFFDSLGRINEMGFWHKAKWIGNYFLYYENGQKQYQYNYDVDGKRNGLQIDYYRNGLIEGIAFYFQGKIIEPYYNFDSLGNFINKEIFIYDSLKKDKNITATDQKFSTDSMIIDYVKNENSNIHRIVNLQKTQAAFELNKHLLDSEKQKNKLYLMGGLIFSVLFLFILYFLVKNVRQKKVIVEKHKEIQEQKKLVDEKQKDIIDSITYARRIQQSLLPTEKYIDKSLTSIQDKTLGN